MLGEGEQVGDTASSVNLGLTDDLLRQLLKRLEAIDENTKKANAEKMGIGGSPTPPLTAPPAGGAGKRGS